MQTMILETFLGFGLCLAAVMIFAITDNYHEAQLRRQQRLPSRPQGAGVRFGAVLRQISGHKACLISGFHGH